MNRFIELDDLTWWRVKPRHSVRGEVNAMTWWRVKPRPSGRGEVNALQWEQELKEKMQ